MPLPPSTSSSLQSILTSLLNLQTSASSHSAKRYYSYLFRDLPDKIEYSDYYLFIKEPRCLNGIMDSLKKGIYSSPQAVAYDLFLVWQNAREYNEQGSQVFNDSEKLESYMQKLWNERSPPLPSYNSLPRPGTLPPAGSSSTPAPNTDDSTRKHKKIKLTSSSLGTPSSSSTKKRISVVPPQPDPAPSKPSLTLKLKAPSTSANAGGPEASGSTPSVLLSATTVKKEEGDSSKRGREDDEDYSTPASSKSSKKERRAKERAEAEIAAQQQQEREYLKAPVQPPPAPAPAPAPAPITAPLPPPKPIPTPTQAPPPPQQSSGVQQNFGGIPDEDPGWLSGDLGDDPTAFYLDILRRLREHTDVNGRVLATPLMSLPDPALKPEYYKQVMNPVALDTIQERVENHEYESPEAFDRELHYLFQIAKRYIRPDAPGPIYTDLIVLQRLYQELTKRVSRYEPAKPTATSGSISSVSVGPGNIQQKRQDSPGVGEEGKAYSSGRVTTKDKVFVEGINFKGDILRSGDWVHLLNPDNPAKPIIAQIFKVWKKPDSAQRCISVCWYYRPEETIHPASRQFYEHEVFKTSNFVDHSVEDFIERCFVMFFTRYVRGRPKPPFWNPGIPLYVVEHRYKDELKSFKKIKNWNSCVPEEIRRNEYELDVFPDERVEILPRVKSPFVRGVAGPGGLGEAMENEEEEQARYHFLPTGEPATAQRLRAKDAEQQSPSLYGQQQSPAPMRGAMPYQNYVTRPQQPVAMPQSTFQIPPPAPVVAPVVVNGLTPAEEAIKNESFNTVPESIQSKFRTDAHGDLLWFAAPPIAPQVPKRPHHSLEYILWKAKKGGHGGKSNGSGDVVMSEAFRLDFRDLKPFHAMRSKTY